jgi:hypothetical protein
MPGCANHPYADAWCTIEILMPIHVEDVLQHVHRQVSKQMLKRQWKRLTRNLAQQKIPTYHVVLSPGWRTPHIH